MKHIEVEQLPSHNRERPFIHERMNSDNKNSGTSDDVSMDKKFVAKNSVNLAETILHSAAHGFATEAIRRFFIEEQKGFF